MATPSLGNLLSIVLPKRKARSGGTSVSGTYNPQSPDRILSTPQYTDHLIDVSDSRLSDDSRSLIRYLFAHDPDMSAAVSSYLTMANTAISIIVRDTSGEIDREATRSFIQSLTYLVRPVDYSLGFQMKPDLNQICNDLRYMLLLRGGIAAELVFDKKLQPNQIRNVDLATIEWFETTPGNYKPRQKVSGSQDGIDLDIPTFFVSFYRRDPTTIYTKSPFVAAINTIAARQQVINDLWRILKRTGYPRIAAKVMEDVVRNNMPLNIKEDPVQSSQWMAARMGEIRTSLINLRPDDIIAHYDSIEIYTANDKSPGAQMDISSVIETLNAQNQAGLKTMSTVIGRGTSGVNTSSVEARIAAMNADEINYPVAEILSDIFSFMLHFQGYQGFVDVSFSKAELRPEMELEPQKNMRQARLRKDLSDGLITDDEYHLMMYNRLRPESAPELSGTKFLTANPETDVIDAGGISPNSDPLGRGLAPKGSDMANADGVAT